MAMIKIHKISRVAFGFIFWMLLFGPMQNGCVRREPDVSIPELPSAGMLIATGQLVPTASVSTTRPSKKPPIRLEQGDACILEDGDIKINIKRDGSATVQLSDGFSFSLFDASKISFPKEKDSSGGSLQFLADPQLIVIHLSYLPSAVAREIQNSEVTVNSLRQLADRLLTSSMELNGISRATGHLGVIVRANSRGKEEILQAIEKRASNKTAN